MARVNQAFGRCAHCLRRAEFRVVFQPRSASGSVQDAVAEHRCAHHVQQSRHQSPIQYHALRSETELHNRQRSWTTLSVLNARQRRASR
jgi:hypothetical protein